MPNIEQPIQSAAIAEHESFGEKKNREWNTPREIIGEVVSLALGSTLKEEHRIVNGESNEVWDVIIESGQEAIVRIFHGDSPKFKKEKWALERCEENGVAVPEVFLVKSIIVGDETREVCVESKVAGESLEKVREALNDESMGELRDVLVQLGKSLRKIHSIPTRGFGKLDDKGVALFGSVAEMIAEDKYIRQDYILPAFADDPEQTAVLMRAYEILKRDAGLYASIQPCLIHNDLSPEHVFVKDGEISGLIDFEHACGADPVQEFALWDFKHGKKYPLDYIIEGYCSDGVVIPDLERRLNYWKIYRSMTSLRYCIREGKQKGIERAIKVIKASCEALK